MLAAVFTTFLYLILLGVLEAMVRPMVVTLDLPGDVLEIIATAGPWGPR